MVKTNFPSLYRPPTFFAVVKTDSPSLYSGQNALFKLLQASYTFRGSQNTHSESL